MHWPDFLQQGGPVLPVIVIVSLAGYAVATERLLVWGRWMVKDRPLRRALDPAHLHSALQRTLAAGKPSPLAWILEQAQPCAGLAPAERESAVQAIVLAAIPQVGARIATIGWLGGMLPMLGLLGTVAGMVLTFRSLAETTSRQVLSLGLAEALYTTLAGLLGALPLLAAHHALSRMKALWLTQVERCMALQAQGAAQAQRTWPPAAALPRTHEA